MSDTPPPSLEPTEARRAALQARFDLVFLLLVGASLAGAVYISLDWRYRHDTATMFFLVSLTDHYGYLPWRDWFDVNMPGTYAIYLGIAKIFGYSAPGIRAADFVWMAAVSGSTLAFLRDTPRRVRAFALLFFLLIYLRGGGDVTLQREMLALLPVSLGLWAAISDRPLRRRALLVGLAFGVAATIKPHMAIGWVPCTLWLVASPGDLSRRDRAAVAAWAAAGLAVPVAVAVALMAALGILDDFAAMVPYLRLHSLIGGDHRTHEGWDRTFYLLRQLFRMNGQTGWAVAALGGLALAWDRVDAGQRRRLTLLGGMLGAYWLYPVVSGQFYEYHWLPFGYFAALCTAWLLVPGTRGGAWWAPRVVLLLLLIQVTDAANRFRGFEGRDENRPASGRADAISRYLKRHLKPGDTVQPFDWVGGGVTHAMLLAGAKPATRFVYTFHFYHHVDDPYIEALRLEFLGALHEARPDYVVESRFRWPYVAGPHTSADFPAYEAWKTEDYVRVETGARYEIWERRDRVAAEREGAATPGTRAP